MSETGDASWRQRELQRIARCEYKPVPWVGEDWWRPIEGHFAHVSRDDKTKLAYTPDERHGREDRQLRVKPGRYLAKFFPQLSQEIVQQWAQRWAQEHEETPVKFATTPDEIERVYREGPSSCMDGAHEQSGKFRHCGGRHPAHVYGAGDLAVAYLERHGAITARALCFPERKSFDTVYGDEARLTGALEKLAYESTADFVGARLLRFSPSAGEFVCPYIDAKVKVKIAEDFLYLDDVTGVKPHSTNGIISGGFECARCGESTDRSELVHVHGIDEDWCEDCAQEGAYRCQYCEDTVDSEDCTSVGDEIWCDTCVGEHASYCACCEEHGPSDSFVTVGSKDWCESCADRYCYKCERCGEHFIIETEMSYTVDLNEDWCETCFLESAVQCSICEENISHETAHSLGNGGYACAADCAETDCFTCEHCEELYPNSERSERSPAGETNCESCEDYLHERAAALYGRQLSLAIAPGATLLPANCGAPVALLCERAGEAPARDFRRPRVIELGASCARQLAGASCVPPHEAPPSSIPNIEALAPGAQCELILQWARRREREAKLEARRARERERIAARERYAPRVLYAYEGGAICLFR